MRSETLSAWFSGDIIIIIIGKNHRLISSKGRKGSMTPKFETSKNAHSGSLLNGHWGGVKKKYTSDFEQIHEGGLLWVEKPRYKILWT